MRLLFQRLVSAPQAKHTRNPAKRVIPIAVLPLLLAAVLPILAALYLADRQTRQDEIAYLETLADETLRRGINSRMQLVQALEAMKREPSTPCSPANLERMRQISAVSLHLRGMGVIQDGQLRCSTLSASPRPEAIDGKRFVTATGIEAWTDARLPFAPEQPFNIYARHGYATIIHPEVILDIPRKSPDIVIGLVISNPKTVTRERGKVLPAWLERYTPHQSAVIDDGTHLVVFKASKEHNIAGVAASLKSGIHRSVWRTALFLVPIGLFGSALFGYAVVVLTRWGLSVPAQLREALKRHDMYVRYQPIVDMRTGRWIGAEALLRWQKPDGTHVPPDEFIASAEKVGLIQDVTRYVTDIVLRDLPTLLKIQPGFHVSINFSALDMQEGGPIDYLRERLHRLQIPPETLIVELTERGLFDMAQTQPLLEAVQAMGVRVAIDDFGTGYSSLSVLESCKLDIIKIDKLFVAAIGTQAANSPVTTHIISMAQKLGIELVAEGVETQAQADFLRDSGVQYAQGWLYARPMAIEELRFKLRPMPI
ncbi:EAL domain-containing protein [Hydrogenophaga sp. OTU3427]|uniref:EAL domain-containing protein n=1 Tax=Hydrogenophaga sp. OTU3427 TaxID=3043856 RepID=UPI00313D1318